MALDLHSHTMVEVDGLIIVGADVKVKVCWEAFIEVLDELAPNALSLATRPYTDAHQVASLRYFDVVLSLKASLLLDVLFAGVLDEEGCIAHDGLSVFLASDYNLVHIRLPESLHHATRVLVFVEGVAVDLT